MTTIQNKKRALSLDSARDLRLLNKTSNVLSNNITLRRARVKTRICRRLLELGFHLLLATLGAVATASWAIPAAYAERGYSAVGGEWFLIGAVFIAVLYMTEAVRSED